MGVARGPHRQTLPPSGFRPSVLPQWRSPAGGRQRGDEVRAWLSLAPFRSAASPCDSTRPSWPCSLSLIPAPPPSSRLEVGPPPSLTDPGAIHRSSLLLF